MGLQLRTGKNGKNVTSDSDGRLYAGIAGTDRYVLDDGNKLAASLSDSNTLVVQSGAMLINGRHVTLDGTQTWNIPNGAQGKKRSNLCVVRYTKDSNGTETAEAVTLSGDLTDGDPVDPTYNDTSILQNRTTISDYPLYRVITDGISANDPVPLFNVLTPLATLGASVDQLFLIRKETIVDSITVPGGDYEDVRKDITPPSGYIPVAYTSLTPESAHCPISQFRIKKSTNPGKYELSVVVRCVNSGSVTLSEIGADVLYVRSSLVQDLRS